MQAKLTHYLIGEEIGAGAMGVVYRARDERLEREVALKVLPPGTLSDEAARKRFRKEALALSKINHPNIATIFDFDTENGTDFLVEELIQGQSLDQMLASGPLGEKELLNLGVQLCEGLAAAHEQGIVHRDLKPANVRVTGDGRLKILDFGLAKTLRATTEATATLSETQMVSGTLPYMSPEQLLNDKLDGRTDIWAAGCVLYEAATGRRPFPGSGVALSDAILHTQPEAPAALNGKLSPGLEAVILKCLEKDPELRYGSARDIAVDLRRVAAGATTTKVAPPTPRGAWRIGIAMLLLAAMATSAWWLLRHRGAKRPAIRAVAVLPLANMSGDANQEFFADGMTEALITDLSKIQALKVISRTSVMQYKGAKKPLREIARELGVDGVIEGSVTRSGKRVRVTAQLIDAGSDTHLWANSFDRDTSDVLALQSDVARAIAREILVAVTPAEQRRLAASGRVNPEAHEAYLKGRYFWWKRDATSLAAAKEMFLEAIAKDPSYAPAYAGLADVYSTSVNNGMAPPGSHYREAKDAALKAVATDEELAEAHVALGRVYRNFDWDWEGAEKEYRRAIELNPNSGDAYLAYANQLSFQGRYEEAIAANRQAQLLDPLAIRISAHMVSVLYFARRYDEAIAASKKALEIAPKDPMTRAMMGKSYLQKGMPAEAVRELEAAYEGVQANASTALVSAYAAAGRREDARRVLAELETGPKGHYVSSYMLAMGQVGFSSQEAILQLLETAYREHDPSLPYLNADPVWDRMRTEPRFVDLLRRMKLR